MVEVQSGRVYQIINVKGGTNLDLSGGDNKSIIGYENTKGENQKWIFEQQGGQWVIRSAGSGAYLGVEGSPEDGKPVVALEYPYAFDIWPDEHDNSVYRIFIPGTTKNFDLADHGSSTPGTKVQLWDKTLGKGQTWRFEDA